MDLTLISFLFNFIFILSLYFTLKYIKNSNRIFKLKQIVFKLNEEFIKKSKKRQNNIEVLVHLHFNTCLTNILIEKLNNLDKNIFLMLKLNEKKLIEEFQKDIIEIILIDYNKEYKIDYFIKDLEILKNKDKVSKKLRMNTFFNLLLYFNNKKELKNLLSKYT